MNTSEVAVLLGFQEHDIAPLVEPKLLKPLGKPAPNAPKYFTAIEVLACAANRDWLLHATRAIAKHWAMINCPRLRIHFATEGETLRPCRSRVDR